MKELSLHILDIVQNSIVAQAKLIEIKLHTDFKEDVLLLTINDNGRGMPKEYLEKVTDPFVTSRTTRDVGMGISLLKDASELAEGRFEINSIEGIGTKLICEFKISSIDRLPIGDFSGTIRNLIMSNIEIDFLIELKSLKKEDVLDTRMIKKELEGVPINNMEVLNWIYECLNESVETVFGGVLNEIVG